MTFPFDGFEVAPPLRPAAGGHAFDLDTVLSAVLALAAQVPSDAFTGAALGPGTSATSEANSA